VETLLCGKVPIVSTEIAPRYEHLSEMMIVVDPTDLQTFAETIDSVIRRPPHESRLLGEQAWKSELINFDAYLDWAEKSLHEMLA
jgi:trehalose-6-phosphate synthase